MMTDPKASRVIEVAEGRSEESADILWNSLTNTQKSHISAVTIDMWQAYENSVASHAPQAEIVFDRFHISKHLNEGVDKVRREEHRELMKEGDERLKGMRYHFLFNARSSTKNVSRNWMLFRNSSFEPSSLEHQGLLPLVLDEPMRSPTEFFDHWYNWRSVRDWSR